MLVLSLLAESYNSGRLGPCVREVLGGVKEATAVPSHTVAANRASNEIGVSEALENEIQQ